MMCAAALLQLQGPGTGAAATLLRRTVAAGGQCL